MGETRGMAFGEAVGTETFDLLEHPLRELGIVSPTHHAADQAIVIDANALGIFESGHGAAKLIRLTRREAGGDNRDPHRLFLEQRHAEGAAEHVFQFVGVAMFRRRLGVDRLLQVPAAAEIGVPRSNPRNF